jgi:hypothetical protein
MKCGAYNYRLRKVATNTETGVTYTENGIQLVGLAQHNLNITFKQGVGYGDNRSREFEKIFDKGTADVEVNQIPMEDYAYFSGATYTAATETPPAPAVLTKSIDDVAPVVSEFYIENVRRDNVSKWRIVCHPTCQMTLGSANNVQTKGANITFNNEKLQLEVLPPADGKWEKTWEFDTQKAAETHLNSLCPLTET